jgi:hypothetical protein
MAAWPTEADSRLSAAGANGQDLKFATSFSKPAVRMERPGPTLDEHTSEVLVWLHRGRVVGARD